MHDLEPQQRTTSPRSWRFTKSMHEKLQIMKIKQAHLDILGVLKVQARAANVKS
jgi:hypothetical protein